MQEEKELTMHTDEEELIADAVEAKTKEELEKFKLKTCLDDLFVKDIAMFWDEDKTAFTVYVSIRHKHLDFTFARNFQTNWKWVKQEGEHIIVGNVIHELYSNVLVYADTGKAGILEREGETLDPKDKFVYHPEYDKEKKAWFILDEDDNRVY